MSKYIPADKLLAEIERLCAEHSSRYGMDEAAIVLDKLEDFITSLQQEQQIEDNKEEKALSLQIQAYLTTASDELYAPGKRLYTKEHHEGIHECMKMWQKLHQYYFSTKQEQPEVDLEKAARYVYESWMGGTMDDVRRDMVELGKVLNARKGE